MAPSPSPSPSSSSNKNTLRATIALADAASSLCAIFLITLILVASNRESNDANRIVTGGDHDDRSYSLRGNQLLDRPCDEIYVVGDGETLHTISDKCGDPYIVERNPHIHDPDDVFPGLVIKITPTKKTRKLLMS
ncbi:uncharacterized protein LOC115683099 [Syzygium oleosum]|uniref:uncharacterized protein LOC115683099 n=1 Tax=Syzygium oleosum TaxID=219896 RepID=UPI0011D21D29|nr:uncharacterized protein LOC115683099 [Syzygium oleosum]